MQVHTTCIKAPKRWLLPTRAMDQTDAHPGYFVVSAKRSDGFIQQTRKVASSAIVLALSWRDAGHSDITIIDPNGVPVTPEGYRDEAIQRIENGLHLRPSPDGGGAYRHG